MICKAGAIIPNAFLVLVNGVGGGFLLYFLHTCLDGVEFHAAIVSVPAFLIAIIGVTEKPRNAP